MTLANMRKETVRFCLLCGMKLCAFAKYAEWISALSSDMYCRMTLAFEQIFTVPIIEYPERNRVFSKCVPLLKTNNESVYIHQIRT
jgi:hypothetical protein